MKKRVVVVFEVEMNTDVEREMIGYVQQCILDSKLDRAKIKGWKTIGFVFPRQTFIDEGPNKPNFGNIGWRVPEW